MSTASLATLLRWHPVVGPAPKLLVLPPDVASLDEAEAAIELWEHYKRRTLDPWQRLSVQIKMATRSDGRWAARTTGEEVPRQAGKGDAEEVVELWGLAQRSELILHTVHDAVLLATRTQERMLSLIDGHADLRRKKKRAWTGTGQQMIEMRNGGTIWYRTRTGGGGRGVDEVDRIVVDEAQHAESAQIEATSPTQLASVNPQTNVMGTGAIDGKSAWWWSVRRRALMPNPGEFGYLGFTAEELSVVGDRIVTERPDVSTVEKFLALIELVHPAMRRQPELVGFFAEEYRKLGPEGAAREYLLVWDPEPTGDAPGVIDWSLWSAGERSVTIASHRCEALVMSRDRKVAWIAKAGRDADDVLVADVVAIEANLTADQAAGRGVALRVKERWPELVERNVECIEVATKDYAAAVSMVRDAVAAGRFAHASRRSLDSAVKIAQVDKSGRWVGTPDVDVAPLEAMTLALSGVPAPGVSARVAMVIGGPK